LERPETKVAPIALGSSTDLEQDERGLWVSKTRSGVSYPSSGNELCYQMEDTSFWFQHRNRCIVNCVRAYPPSGVIFDVGGGNGFVSLGLQRAGWDAVVVEPGVAGATNAQRRGLLHVICSTFEDAGFRRHTLPAVGMFDVLEHVEDDEGFLRTLHDAIVPGGRIYLTVPAYRWLWSAEDTYAGHFRRYTLPSLTLTLHRAGFDVEFRSYMFSMLPLPIFLRRSIPHLLGFEGVNTSERAAKDHGTGPLNRLFDRVFAWERSALERRRAIPWGSTCLVVAKSG
jgi:SAM-dependent methyltransferase